KRAALVAAPNCEYLCRGPLRGGAVQENFGEQRRPQGRRCNVGGRFRTLTAPMAGYSGTPLPKKLGIKPESRLAIVGAPDGFDRTLGAPPERGGDRRRVRGALGA